MSNSKTFRLFVSSTFSDFKREREVLHGDVFPSIDKYLLKKYPGYTFQPIDLRWGVTTEAQLDQKTLDVCLNEVKACKHYLHPNFLIMIGNRYGWVPLPYAIEKNEFENILDFYENDSSNNRLLTEWYQKDRNNLLKNGETYAYVLKEREPNGKFCNWEAWEKVESNLKELLQFAAKKLLKKDTKEYDKYFFSATESEVIEGIYDYLEPTNVQKEFSLEQNDISKLDRENVFGFIRDISNKNKLSYPEEITNLFIDHNQNKVEEFKDRLNKSNIEIKEEQVIVDKLLENDISFKDENKYIENFKNFVFNKLKSIIDEQISKQKDITSLQQEILEQEQFKKSKIKIFEGREEELDFLMKYISNQSKQPCIVYGTSGIGKTAFMAKTIDTIEKEQNDNVVCYKFIGATASSSNIRTLLESIIDELSTKKIVKKPEKYEIDIQKFNLQIKELMNSIEKETIIIIDALNQLFHKDQLRWLPEVLPEKLKIIVSILNGEDTHYYDLLVRDIKIDKCNHLPINPISNIEVERILDQLLRKENRVLTSTQKSYFLQQVENSENSPLYLKIAFEEAKTWKSSSNDFLSVGITNIINEFIGNLTKKFHHDEKVVYKVLGLLATSKEGLSEKQILDLLSRDNTLLDSVENHYHTLSIIIEGEKVRKFPISVWIRIFDQLKPFLVERIIDEKRLIGFFHRQFHDVVSGKFGSRAYKLFNEELIRYYYEVNLSIKDKFSVAFLYNIKNLMYHLYKNNEDKKLKNILGENIQSLFFLTQHILEDLGVYISYLNARYNMKEYLVEKTFDEYNFFINKPKEVDWIISDSFTREHVEQDWFIPGLYNTLLNVGKLLDYSGFVQDALEIYSDTVKQNLEWYGKHNIFVSDHIFQLAELYLVLNNIEESKKYYNMVLTIDLIENPFYKTNITGYNKVHEFNVIQAKTKLLTFKQNMDEVSSSEKKDMIALIDSVNLENFFKSEDPEKIIQEIANMDEHDMLKFLKIQKDNISMEEYNELSVNLSVALGFKFYEMNDYKKALEYYFAAEKALLSKYDENHYRMGWVYPGIALCYIKAKQFTKGEDYLSKAAEIIENYSKGTHPRTILDLALLEYERTIGMLEVIFQQIMNSLDNIEFITTLIDLAVDEIEKGEIYVHPISLQILLMKAGLLKSFNEVLTAIDFVRKIKYYSTIVYEEENNEYLMLKAQLDKLINEISLEGYIV